MTRIFLLKQTIIQVILPDTKTFVTMKENHILETTDFHFPSERLVNTIDTKETLNSKIPKFEISSSSKQIPPNKSLDSEALASYVAYLEQSGFYLNIFLVQFWVRELKGLLL
jgi:hypothetical protein